MARLRRQYGNVYMMGGETKGFVRQAEGTFETLVIYLPSAKSSPNAGIVPRTHPMNHRSHSTLYRPVLALDEQPLLADLEATVAERGEGRR